MSDDPIRKAYSPKFAANMNPVIDAAGRMSVVELAMTIGAIAALLAQRLGKDRAREMLRGAADAIP